MTQIYYFTGCCGNVTSFGITSGDTSSWVGFTATTGNVYGVSIGTFSGCVTYSGSSIEQIPNLPILNGYTPQFTQFNNCTSCIEYLYPCYTPPTPSPPPIITGYKNECGIITILPMVVDCAISNPSVWGFEDGEASVRITGGTPPYTTTWTYDDNVIISPAIGSLGIGSYTATTVDYWGDYTATTVCKLSVEKNCYFSASIEEYTPPITCTSSVVPPTTLNGITITDSSTGSVGTYTSTATSCNNITTPANSKWLGLGGSFTYTMNFSIPINNLIIFIVGTGQDGYPNQENFIFTTNTGSGLPSITSSENCYTTINGNEILSGGAPTGGGGGKFLITNDINFTSITISGDGGWAGSVLSVCTNSF
jgi:hypothetical protein